jgi:ABC-type transport system involved in cytochrome bd biosynthesis fused ATPase/permease subunit
MEALARKSGLAPRPVKTPIPPHDLVRDGNEALGRWIEAAAGCLGLEAEPLEAPYGEAEQLVRNAGPALLLLNGLDRQTLGPAGWRRWVVAAPQFHENHVLTGTFAFNLLMGRRWPPQPGDMEEAEALCGALGLGDLLGRMPAGLLQIVGETGWQLSHGEKSRLYIARALLQGADFVVLDESFAALDPENLRRALRCVLDRASTLLVIAHP